MKVLTRTISGAIVALFVALTPLSAAAADNVSMKIKDGDIRDVLTALSSLGGQSIVTDETVKGNISISFDNVPFDSALDLVTRTKGLAYRNVHGVIVVSAVDQINKYYGDVAVYKLNYAKAEDIKNMLKDIVKGEGSGLSVDPITNSIVFTGNSADEQKLRDTLALIDVPTKQVTLEAKIISISNEDSKKLGISWDWDKLPSPEENSSSSSSSNSDDKYGGIIHLGHGYQSRFQATLNALFANGKAKILATPRIITIPGKEASIFIGDHIPVLTEKNDDGKTTTSTEYVDAGIKLSYTPIVSNDDYITAVVHTEVSTPTLVSELRNYRITSRSADTNVRMRNGETLIIGGLINEEEQETLRKIPFLSNLPILGELFKDRSKSKNKTEVMMILTPHITEAGESPAIYDTAILENFLPQEPTADTAKTQDAKNNDNERMTMREKTELILGRSLPQ
ncbi:MAG TPA: type II and III secretion system protein [Candidatus Avacidaminococcus intestinavium]|uniref:Type II and III secretion system protein n=1 Tax=Candidatus Avacidaminococcus intestinavium TaxID=2840684 RepID=A0A9D1MNW8_9FIRM|nr:type II and III secretion system protein [Candidatus Avacidaminococcus intestinavium]